MGHAHIEPLINGETFGLLLSIDYVKHEGSNEGSQPANFELIKKDGSDGSQRSCEFCSQHLHSDAWNHLQFQLRQS